ncbi:MAG TPA: patatin-like phospholipase family protein [Candidatus Krumholzibacteria bacterium]|nr:patatin-like phospholipase family protein [Candidatus Krumholzibacteria bacterium]HPD71991.1 patatin-like phospholipase family protein [Candidatus Krumholzibacteria bacterium]HRY41076.1 patatin-like phospholipase family protein [Candidatus Krumholzibacteria bacterium]
MNRPLLGLALGSGGARGLAHCGVLQAIHEAGLPVDAIAGTSMGAIVGALYARDPDPAATWQHLVAYVEDREFADHWATFLPRRTAEDREGARRWDGLFDFMHRGRIAVKAVALRAAESRARLYDPLARLFAGTGSFAELKVPFAAVALDLTTGRMVAQREGSLLEGLYASCAIPGVFPPVVRGAMVIVDGGGPFRVPVEAVRDLGADFVVAVDIPAYHEHELRTGFDLGMRSNAVALDRLNDFVCAQADLLIRPGLELYHWADFRSGEAIRDIGYEAARAALPELERLWALRQSPVAQAIRRVGSLFGGGI